MPMTRTSRRLQKLSPERKNTEADLLALNEKLNIRTPRKAQATVVHHDNESDLTDKEETGETSPKRKNGTMSVHKSPTKKQVTPEKRRTLRSKKSVTLTTESENDSTDKEDEEDALSRRSTRVSKLQLTPEKKRPLRSKKSVTLAPESTKKALARESTFGETSHAVFKTPSKKTPSKTPRKTPSRSALKKEDTFDEFVQPRKSLVNTFNGVADSTVNTPKKSLNRQDSFGVATTPASTNVYAYARNRVRTMNASSDEDQLIGRESEIDAIRTFLESSQSSLYVSGPPGGGKTAAVRLVVNGYDGRMHWTNCMALSGVDNLLDELRFVKSKSKSLLVILDEIDTLRHEDLLELFKIAAEIDELKLIGIANALDLTSNQLQNSDHPPVHLQVHPYTAQQLSTIINDRLGEYKQLFMPQALELLSRKVSAMTGDIRQVVSVVTLCLDTVEKEQKKLRGAALCDVTVEEATKVTMPTMLKSITARVKASNKSANNTKIELLNLHSKIALLCVMLTMRRRSQLKSSLPLYESYCYLLNTHSTISPTSKSDFIDLVNVLTSSSILIEQYTQFDQNAMLGTPSKRARMKAALMATEPEFKLQYSEGEVIKLLGLSNGNSDENPQIEQLKRVYFSELKRIEQDVMKKSWKAKTPLSESNNPPIDVFV